MTVTMDTARQVLSQGVLNPSRKKAGDGKTACRADHVMQNEVEPVKI
jgi:hypothetical protein